MTHWIAPDQHPDQKLTLPLLQKTVPVDPKNALLCPESPTIRVDETFVNIWQSGPKSDNAKHIAEAVGVLGNTFNQLIKAGQGKVKTTSKTRPNDLVTEMDTGIEMLIRIWLNTHFPTHKIIGEEGPKDTLHPDDIVWYIDPIDGTTNFVNLSDQVTCHWGAVKNSQPFVTFVSEPIRNRSHIAYVGQPPSDANTPAPTQLGMGTEYMEHRHKEAALFRHLLTKLDLTAVQVKCMGANLLEILNGRSIAFYKPRIKPWDIIAPLALIELTQPGYWNIILHYTPGSDALTPDHCHQISPFNTSDAFVDHLNTRYAQNCRIGLITVTPKNRPEILESILEEFST